MTLAARSAPTGAHAFTFEGLGGQPLPLAQFAGKAVLVVNTASKCGYTPQYADLEKLWQAYRDKGLAVLGVPSNDFGQQEPGSNLEIAEFCSVVYRATFPMAAKAAVTGPHAHPFYAWAGQQAGFVGQPRWNFHKYLIGRNGQFLDWFSTVTVPTSAKIIRAVEAHLKEGAA